MKTDASRPSAVRGWFLAGLAALYFNSQMLKADGIEPQYFAAKPGSLMKVKARLIAGDKDLAHAVQILLNDADKALKETPPSVTEKTNTPPSGDRHDYMSLAPYFWPNPKTANGLPYVRHDGSVNPQSRDTQMNDSPRIKLMGDSIETLALAYYFSGDDKYAAQAARFARSWFLDQATRMNPNLKFAQAVLGVNDGRGTGIIEGRHIAIAADSLGLLAGSKSWTANDQENLNAWLNTYLDWLLTSKAGVGEHAAKNNHGTWFDVQTAELALCLNRANDARCIIDEAKQRRIAVQIEPDGRQPFELARTNSLSYSRFNLEALCELATLGQHVDVDLWHFSTADGRNIRRAVEFLVPYFDVPAKPWPYAQIKDKHDRADILPIFREAALAFHEPVFDSVIAKYTDASNKRWRLFHP